MTSGCARCCFLRPPLLDILQGLAHLTGSTAETSSPFSANPEAMESYTAPNLAASPCTGRVRTVSPSYVQTPHAV